MKMLKKHFGLQANILHEVLSNKLHNFLPNTYDMAECSYYTTCFLGLPSAFESDHTSPGRMAPDQHDLYLQKENHLAFHQIIDLSKVNITEKQRLLFARALRILGLKPFFHMSELEALLTPTITDEALRAINDGHMAGCPKPPRVTQAKKMELLRDYMQAKNSGKLEHACAIHLSNSISIELAKQPWPQFMIMATSDAVAPG